MSILDETTTDLAATVFTAWLDAYGAAQEAADPVRVAQQFVEDGYWRDILAFTWDYRTFSGRNEIEAAAVERLATTSPRAFRLALGRIPPRLVSRSRRSVVEGFFDFETDVGRCTGFARLLLDDKDPLNSRAWIVLTTLQELAGFEETVGDRRPSGVDYSVNFAGDNWLDKRRKAIAHNDTDPQVLIVGGGQGGLSLAARLAQIGVDAVIVERHDRIGDNWRTRYHSLTLHNEVWANSMAYLPFPDSWPTFVPKDKLAGWLESYADIMELNVWTGTEFLDGTYDETSRTWTATLRRHGAEREVRVQHIVLAVGVTSGIPKTPKLTGLDEFSGNIMHSTDFRSGTEYAGRRAIVVGTGNSGHDVAQDLHSNGAEVTIVQRSPTCVVSLVPSGTLVYALYSEGPVEDIDFITASIPYPVLRETYQWLTKRTCELDAELLDKLHKVGFETDYGDDNTGFHMKYLRTGGGYYINVGCADLIADRKIALVHARDIDTFTHDGMALADGTLIPADIVVLATGYEKHQESVRKLFGDEVAEKVGDTWGFNDQGFMKNMWARTGQDHLWVMGGALMEARVYSRFLALQIKADLEGLLPPRPPNGREILLTLDER